LIQIAVDHAFDSEVERPDGRSVLALAPSFTKLQTQVQSAGNSVWPG